MWDEDTTRLGTWRNASTLGALLRALQAVHERVVHLAALHLHPLARCSIRSFAIGGLMYLAHPSPLPPTSGTVKSLAVFLTASSAIALLSHRQPSTSTGEEPTSASTPALTDLSQLEVRAHPDCTDVMPSSVEELQEVSPVSQGANFMVRLVAFSDGTSAQRLFALKSVGPESAVADVGHARACLARETDLLFKCSHKSIVKALRVLNAPDDKHAVLMEWLPCGDLLTLLQRKGHLCEESAIFHACQVVSALEHLHARQIAHRDLKPENLLLDAHGHLKLTGLSYAKIISQRSYTIVGTLPYIAPEVLLHEGHGLAVDWWALGVLLYEITVGKPPFADVGDEFAHFTCSQIISGDVAYPTTMSIQLRDLISRLLDKLPEDRLGNGPKGATEVWCHPCFSDASRSADVTRGFGTPFSDRATHDRLPLHSTLLMGHDTISNMT